MDERSLRGATVALFEARQSCDLARLVTRHGGVPWLAPALTEKPIADDALATIVDRLIDGRFDVVVLLTGAGTRLLLEHADRRGELARVQAALARATVVCRGPKPAFVLRQHDLRPTIVVPEPHTTPKLLETLATLPLRGHLALVVSAGEPFDEPGAFLRGAGAAVLELELYRWELTETHRSRLAETIEAIIGGRIDIALFTTQVQLRHLLLVADRMWLRRRLVRALRRRVRVGAIGPTCAAALRSAGIEPAVEPEHPKMGHLVTAMAQAWTDEARARDAIAESALEYTNAVLGGWIGTRRQFTARPGDSQ